AKTRKRLAQLPGHQPSSVRFVQFSPCGKFILSASADRKVRLWDAEKARMIREYIDHSKEVNGVAFSPDGTRAISASTDKSLRLWNLPGFVACIPVGEMRVFKGHSKPVETVAFGPGGKGLLSGGQDHTLRL